MFAVEAITTEAARLSVTLHTLMTLRDGRKQLPLMMLPGIRWTMVKILGSRLEVS